MPAALLHARQGALPPRSTAGEGKRSKRSASIFILLALVCSLPGSLRAVTDTQTGADGSAGQSGGNATALASSADPANTATATGGKSGGPPGAGGAASATAYTAFEATGTGIANATATGGNCIFVSNAGPPLSAAAGGDGNASAAASSASASALNASASGTGGAGSSGENSTGGPGGNVSVSASSMLQTTGLTTVTAQALSGNGGETRGTSANGGQPGTITFGPVFGSSLGSATVMADARGGNGGALYLLYGFSNARAGDGRSVNLNNVVDGNAADTLTLIQTATAGDAGSSSRSGPGVAGNASSIVDRTVASGLQVLDVRCSGTGGKGTFNAFGSGVYGVDAGSGTATSRARNDGGRALATASGTGGASNVGTGSAGGAGSANAAANGGTSMAGQGSSATATAIGAAGSGLFQGPQGAGGAATATASAATTGDGSTLSQATATGGAVATNPALTGNFVSGTATASASGTVGGNASLDVTATAKGGAGLLLLQTSSSSGGAATATASGTTGGSANILARADAGQSSFVVALAQATSSGHAAGGTLSANASTSRFRGVIGSLISLRTTAATVPLNGALASCRAEMAAGTFALDPQALPEALAAANAAPTAAAVNAALSGNATSAARFDPTNSAQLILVSSGGAKCPVGATASVAGSIKFTVAIDLSRIATNDSKNLQLALVNPIISGAGPDSVRLRVLREGATVHDVTLLGSSAARAYFTDHVLDFGDITSGVTGDLDVDILLDVVSSQPGGGFYATTFLGNAAAAPVQTIDQWRAAYFGGGATNSGSAADDANPTGDGYSNLLKFAVGLNPLLPYPPGAAFAVDSTTGVLRMTVSRNPATSGIVLVVEGTSDLSPAGNWSAAGLVIDQNTSTLLQVHDSIPIQPGNERTLRLRVTRM